jgi:hypothetical protein
MWENLSRRVCGKEIGKDELSKIEVAIKEARPNLRSEIARIVCKELNWRDNKGRYKEMSCRVMLLKLERLGLIQLPPPRNGNGNGKGLSRQTVELPEEETLEKAVGELEGLRLKCVKTREESALWNGMIDRYHYLGYTPLPGAQIRYLLRWKGGELGALGWGAASWKVACRDQYIGWSTNSRETHLEKVVNNGRFLLLPWVRSRNLASKVLALSAQQLVGDFEQRYGIRPVLLESYVEKDRYKGTCYRAANWVHVGQTQGRGKCDRKHEARLPVKDVYVYPLTPKWRTHLGVAS